MLELESGLVWGLAGLIVLAVVVPYLLTFQRRRRADRLRLDEARELGIDRPVAQFPFVDPESCIGCGACVKACPEGDVLGVVRGTAVVINGLRCVGHGRCADACPVGAIEIGVGDLKGRRDVPILTDDLESTVPGVFVAGELSGLALIRNAIEQGRRVVATIAARQRAAGGAAAPGFLDLIIVGAGPAGLAAALAAVEQGLRATVVDQSRGLGGTILNFPRRKLVLTRPVEFPGGGGLSREQYTKEEVLEMLGEQIERNRLDVVYGERLESLRPVDGGLEVGTTGGVRRARAVVLALGRRGTPRRLGVPGEESSKVMYQLKDAESYRNRRVLVVGGGDSAIEAAIGLARQSGNEVTISYRKNAFHRIKKKNEISIDRLVGRGKVRVMFESQVESISRDHVVLRTGDRIESIANDEVFVLIGGEPPYALLRQLGLAFGGDPTPPSATAASRLRAGATAALGLALALLGGGTAAAQESPHGDLAVACNQCHTTEDWVPVRRDIPFRHESVGWPLDGMHAVAACAECHRSKVFSRVATACQDCHVDAHQGELGLSCSTCHDTRRWDVRDEVMRSHATSLFPLLAGHARVDCEACHGGVPPTQYALTPTDCVACHRADYEAATSPSHAGFSTDCRSCHGPLADGWRAPGFAHTPLFPLTGAHRTLACAECHRGGTTTSADCFSCHRSDYQGTRDPNHAASGFPTTCQVCHSTTAWQPANFNHDVSRFPLTGAHRRLDCQECHSGGYTGTPTACFSCHRNDYQGTRDPNHQRAGFSTNCQDCHSTSSWDDATANHNDTRFPLTGAHRTLDCQQCHSGGFSGTPTACYACHRSDYDRTSDPNHAAAGYPTTCQNCHNTSDWNDADFNHDASRFPLTGAHRTLDCLQCHAGGFSGTPRECYACHRSDYDGTRDPDHRAAGYPTTCQNCHSTSNWGDADFNHDTSRFPLTGAHRTLDCQQCHAGGFTNTPTACYACHRPEYEATRDPDHRVSGFPTTCQDCHTTSRWEGATFDHDAQFFPIYSGPHRNRWPSCSTCHVAPNNFRVFECTVCHEHNRSEMDSKHREVSNYVYESQACYACHPDGRE